MPPDGSAISSTLDTSRPETLTLATSGTCSPATSLDTTNATFSPASADGRSRAASQVGRKRAPSGPAPVPASLFPLQEGDAERPMSGIYGPTFIASSVPEGPLSSWESRLRGRLARYGSVECALIWRAAPTTSGQLMSRLSPSERLTNASASTGLRNGWATPRASDGKNGGPNSRDGSGSLHLPSQQYRAGWATPCARDGRSARRTQEAWDVRMADSRGIQLNDQMTQASGLTLKTFGANGTKNGGVPNPAFPCWLMGYPAEFLHLRPLATPSWRRSRPKSSPPISTADPE